MLDREEEEEQTEHTWCPGDSCSGMPFIAPDRHLAHTNTASCECLVILVVTNAVTCHRSLGFAIAFSSMQQVQCMTSAMQLLCIHSLCICNHACLSAMSHKGASRHHMWLRHSVQSCLEVVPSSP